MRFCAVGPISLPLPCSEGSQPKGQLDDTSSYEVSCELERFGEHW